MGSAPIAVPPDSLIPQFETAVSAFEANPTAEALRELERIARQILSQLHLLSSAAIAAFRAAMGRLIGAIISAGTALGLGAAVLAFWWGAWTIISGKVAIAKAEHESEVIIGIIRTTLEISGFDPSGRRRCWDRFQRLLIGALEDYYLHPDMLQTFVDILDRLIEELMECLGLPGRIVSTKIRAHLISRVINSLAIFVALTSGLSLREAGAAERPAPEPLGLDDAREAGASGAGNLPYRQGVACGETSENTPEGPITGAGDVSISPSTPLGLFSDADLAAREESLSAWIEEIKKLLVLDEKARAALDNTNDPDGELRGAIARRRKILSAEAERLRAALQNTLRARQVRAACGYPVLRD
jgi:hypothetical protein